jgi:hypothetical protein
MSVCINLRPLKIEKKKNNAYLRFIKHFLQVHKDLPDKALLWNPLWEDITKVYISGFANERVEYFRYKFYRRSAFWIDITSR